MIFHSVFLCLPEGNRWSRKLIVKTLHLHIEKCLFAPEDDDNCRNIHGVRVPEALLTPPCGCQGWRRGDRRRGTATVFEAGHWSQEFQSAVGTEFANVQFLVVVFLVIM